MLTESRRDRPQGHDRDVRRDRVLLGTDFGPVPMSPKLHIDLVDDTITDAGDREKIFSTNTIALLRLEDPSGNWIRTCSILITMQSKVTSVVRDRMPVILEPDTYDLWVDPGMHDMRAASEMMKPYDARAMRCFPVGRRIDNVANDDVDARHLWNSNKLKVAFS